MLASSVSGKPCKATLETARHLLAENHAEEILTDVKQNGNRDRKKELPVWLPLASSFNKGTRKAEEAQPSGFYFLDIDEKGLTEQLWKKVQEEHLIEEFRIVYYAESAGGGTHIWAWRTPGASIEEDIQKLADRLSVSYDSHVTDLARCCFMVTEPYVKLLDPVVFEPLTEDQKKAYEIGDYKSLAHDSQITNSSEQIPAATYKTDYKGLEYNQIVTRLLFKLGYGDQPVEGERNETLYAMSRYLRFVCDFDAQWVYQVLPHWGLPEHEAMATIKSAVASARPQTMPSVLRDLLDDMLAETHEPDASSDDEDNGLCPKVAKKLPGILQIIADHAPAEFKEASLISSMPILGTLATGVRAEYNDGKLNSPSFIVDLWAPQATGKSFVDDLVELLLDPIQKQDDVEWQKEMEYSMSKKDDAEDPMANIRIIEPNIGTSAFLKRAYCAKGKHLFTYAPEIETVLKNNKGGSWTEKNDLFRLAYDNKVWGQHRISKDSFSAKTRLFYNLLMCGTPDKSRAFYADAESGLVSRTTFVELPDMKGAKMPKFQKYSKEEETAIRHKCLELMDEECTVDLPRICKAIEDWDESKRQEYLRTLNPSLDIFRRRSALNGFRAGMVAFMLCDKVETDEAVDFAVWYAERCLFYQMKLYGSKLDAISNAQALNGPVKNVRYYELLGYKFTRQELENLRAANGQPTNVRMIISRWCSEGLAKKIAENLWQKCRP
jgi:hypothetical protein